MGLWTGVLIILVMGVGIPLILVLRLKLFGFNRPSIIAVLIGAALLVLTLVVQPVLYRLPAHVGIFLSGWSLLAYLALVSGLLQEGFKLSVVTKGFNRQAAALGYGFGIAEVFLVVLPALLIVGRLGAEMPVINVGNVGLEAYFLSGWERLNATLFHVFTAMLLSRSQPRPLIRWLGLGFIHAGVNFGGLVATRFYGVFEPNPLLVFYTVFTLLNAFLARAALAGGKRG